MRESGDKKKILITGISGQTGSTMAEELIALDNYEVFGIVRRQSVSENQDIRLAKIKDQIRTFYGDLTDALSLQRIITEVQPDIVFHYAAQSHVRISSDIMNYTMQANVIGTLNLLECLKQVCPKAKLIFAASSEQYGNSVSKDGFQREDTPMMPVSPYGISKLACYHLVKHFREAYGLCYSSSISFNHEGPKRSSNFVTAKVVKTAVEIKRGLKDKLALGNLDACRDWGHAKDVVKAHILMSKQEIPDDYVIATGVTHSVRELCQYVFSKLELDYRDYVTVDERYYRPEELNYLKGDSSKARFLLNWKPDYSFESLLDEMIDFWLKQIPEVHPTQSWHSKSGI